MIYNQLKQKESTKLGASVPALGLSNKAIYEENHQNGSVTDKKGSLADELYKEVYFNIIDLTSDYYFKDLNVFK